MDLKYEQLSALPLLRRIRAARAISKVVCAEAANDKMKQVTANELLARNFSLVALDGQCVVGHVSVDGPVVGALYVNSAYRGQHIATRLVAAATEFVLEQGSEPVAYCNESSVKAFANCGYAEALPDKPNRTKMQHPAHVVRAQQEIGKTPLTVMIAA